MNTVHAIFVRRPWYFWTECRDKVVCSHDMINRNHRRKWNNPVPLFTLNYTKGSRIEIGRILYSLSSTNLRERHCSSPSISRIDGATSKHCINAIFSLIYATPSDLAGRRRRTCANQYERLTPCKRTTLKWRNCVGKFSRMRCSTWSLRVCAFYVFEGTKNYLWCAW